ncbi:MAG TPA: hypothetical protein VGK96_20010, partial [Candidatus Sulfotelmatobacter sp.]
MNRPASPTTDYQCLCSSPEAAGFFIKMSAQSLESSLDFFMASHEESIALWQIIVTSYFVTYP